MHFGITINAEEKNGSIAPQHDFLSHENFTEEILYEYLLAEISLQRGNFFFAFEKMLDLAKKSKDSRLAKRATELAIAGNLKKEAITAAKTWTKLNANSQEAENVLLSLYLSTGQITDAKINASKLLADSNNSSLPRTIMRIQNIVSRNPNKIQASSFLLEVLKPYEKTLHAQVALSQNAIIQGDRETALKFSKKLFQNYPNTEISLLTYIKVINNDNKILELIKNFLLNNPNSQDVRMAYARKLYEKSKIDEAKLEFQILLNQSPNNQTILFALGLLSVQINHNDDAEKYLSKYINNLNNKPDNERDALQALLILSQLSEEKNNIFKAIEWLEIAPFIQSNNSFMNGSNISVSLKLAQLVAKNGDLEKAKKIIDQTDFQNLDDRIKLILGESHILRDQGLLKEALKLIAKSIENIGENEDLLYEQAMLAEKNKNYDLMEISLRKIIIISPKNEHAYNALGYSLADRNIRLEEANLLINKAHELSPEDPFILDSLGWLEYRMGKFKEAESILRRAYFLKSDAEIAAHLGEVLWKLGQFTEAKDILIKAKNENPENETLNKIIIRFKVNIK